MDELMNGYIVRTDGSMDVWIDGWLDGWMFVGMNELIFSISETIPAWVRLE
jgi:hypothetical protein